MGLQDGLEELGFRLEGVTGVWGLKVVGLKVHGQSR